MIDADKKDLDIECQRIIDNVPLGLDDDKKMRYLCHELALLLSKNVEFFYEKENMERRREIYNNYDTIENNAVICKNAAYKHVEIGKKLGLNCQVIETNKDSGEEFIHCAIEFIGNDNKRYIINPVPDFYRIQLGFSTKSFCSVSEYHDYTGGKFDTMSDEYLREMDKELGYLPGNMYTEELLTKFQSQLNINISKHIIATTDVYQEFYLKLLQLMKDDNLTLDEKVQELKSLDPDFDKHKNVLKECLEQKELNSGTRKIMTNLSIKSLIKQDGLISREVDTANYVGQLDVTKIKDMQKEILIYKFNFLMKCLPQLTNNLTGFIENKNFIDEVKKYIFKKGYEREALYRHTVTKVENGKPEYYMMLSLKPNENTDNKIYCFYNQKTKECAMNIEPISFMLENSLTPRKDSSLSVELNQKMHMEDMLCDCFQKEEVTNDYTI